MKFYAVKNGRQPGIYYTWEEARKQIIGFSKAEYKSFTQITEATDYLNWDKKKLLQMSKKNEDNLQNAINKIIDKSKQTPKPAIKHKAQLSSKQNVTVSNSNDFFATVYTDGGTRNSGAGHKGGKVAVTDKAAWAYRIEWAKKETHGVGGQYGATNNKMEQYGLINALKKLIELGFNQKDILFILDSKYVLNPINKGWLKSWKKQNWKKGSGKLANKKEWQTIDRLLSKFPHAKFTWTKGHANNQGNEFVDHLLNEYMDEQM